MASIRIDDLSSVIKKELTMYSEDVVEAIDNVSLKAAEDGVDELREKSPRRTGKYAKSWAMKTEKQLKQPAKRIIHNKKWQLPHLLEYGHAKANGGRVEGIPHIQPVEEMVNKEFVEGVEEVIRNG